MAFLELDQLFRRPSAEPFHCSTLSAIMRGRIRMAAIELGVAADLTLHTLTFGMEQVAQGFES